jgi:hypothetical protein
MINYLIANDCSFGETAACPREIVWKILRAVDVKDGRVHMDC